MKKRFQWILPTLITIFIILLVLYFKHQIIDQAITLNEIAQPLKESFFLYLPKILFVIILFFITKIFIELTLKTIKKGLEKKGRPQDILLFQYPYKIIVWFTAILISVSIIYKNFTSLILSLGLVGFGITFALQKPILNFVGWLTIIAKRPYWIGDRIKIGEVKGDVFDLNIMYTSLSEFGTDIGDESSGRSITIPNEYVFSQAVYNYTKGSVYIWDTINLSITYESDWKEATDLLEQATAKIVVSVMKHNYERWVSNKNKFQILGKDVVEKPIMRLNLKDSFIQVSAVYLTDSRKRGLTKTEITKEALELISKAKNVRIAYPHMHIIKDKN